MHVFSVFHTHIQYLCSTVLPNCCVGRCVRYTCWQTRFLCVRLSGSGCLTPPASLVWRQVRGGHSDRIPALLPLETLTLILGLSSTALKPHKFFQKVLFFSLWDEPRRIQLIWMITFADIRACVWHNRLKSQGFAYDTCIAEHWFLYPDSWLLPSHPFEVLLCSAALSFSLSSSSMLLSL